MQNQVSTQNSVETSLQMSVDSHFHVFTAQQAVLGARYSPSYAASLATWQAASQAVGVTHGVLVQTSFKGTDNAYLLAHLKQHPDTLRGVAVVAPSALPAVKISHFETASVKATLAELVTKVPAEGSEMTALKPSSSS